MDRFFKLNGTTSVLLGGDVLARLSELPDDTFNVIITSPPYFWARDYGFEGQIGHEDTLEEYVQALAAVASELKRVLHPEGVFYLNIGDTYYSGNGQPHGKDPKSPSRNFMRRKFRAVDRSGWDIPKKSLLGVPWKVAFALQEDGWTVRSSIIWNRGNAFVEPTARDRPHRQYEHIFLFSKSRWYSYDRAELVEEDVWNIPIERRRTEHNAAFPVELVNRCISTGSPPGGLVLDPFLGSGTTMAAAAALGRRAVGIEMSPTYLDESRERILEIGAREVGPMSFADIFDPPAPGWSRWPGNRRNFRRPGSKRTKAAA